MISWTEELSVGVKELDDQHKRMFALAEALMATVRERSVIDDEVMARLRDVADLSMQHMDLEESYMEKFSFASAEHVAAHEFFKERIRNMLKKLETARIDGDAQAVQIINEIAFFANKWHIEHILTMDKQYTKCFNEHGLH
jgi:hemerythrin